MKKCTDCGTRLASHSSRTKDGFSYQYWKCQKCGEELLDMGQLEKLAASYSSMKKAKISKWGQSLGLRIPKEFARRYNFKNEKEVTLIPEEDGLRIIA
jgi:Zn-finger nucleic acid-binding protein